MLKFKLLLAVVVLVIVGWTSAWFIGASFLRKTIETEMVASNGQMSCAEEAIGGFPFRLFFDCANMTLVDDDLTYQLSRAKVSVVVTQPKLVVGFLQSPLEVRDAFSGAHYFIHWDEAKMSLRHDLSRLHDGRLEITKMRFNDTGGAGADTLSADLVSLYLQTRDRENGPAAGEGETETYALFVAGDAVSIPDANIANGSVQIDLLATQLPPIDGRAPSADLLRVWQRNGGTLTLRDMAVRINGAKLDATGVFSLNDRGQVNGLSEITLVNFNTYLAATPLGPLTGGLFGASGNDTQQMSFAIRDGVVFVGPLPMLQLSPLF